MLRGPVRIDSHIFSLVSSVELLMRANSADTSAWRFRNRPCILTLPQQYSVSSIGLKMSHSASQLVA